MPSEMTVSLFTISLPGNSTLVTSFLLLCYTNPIAGCAGWSRDGVPDHFSQPREVRGVFPISWPRQGKWKGGFPPETCEREGMPGRGWIKSQGPISLNGQWTKGSPAPQDSLGWALQSLVERCLGLEMVT